MQNNANYLIFHGKAGALQKKGVPKQELGNQKKGSKL